MMVEVTLLLTIACWYELYVSFAFFSTNLMTRAKTCRNRYDG